MFESLGKGFPGGYSGVLIAIKFRNLDHDTEAGLGQQYQRVVRG